MIGVMEPKFRMTLLALTRIFTKKIELIYDFCLFVNIRHILDKCKSQGLPLKEETIIFKFFCVMNGFYDFGNIFFSKKKQLLLNFAFLSVSRLVT